jgi:hypothetical protein
LNYSIPIPINTKLTRANPLEFNDLIVTLNGVTLANGTDYHQSTTNVRKVIFNGIIYGTKGF